jgi:hypothetical protein
LNTYGFIHDSTPSAIKKGFIRGLDSLEGDNSVVFYNLNASEIWPDKRGDLIRGDW